MSFSLFTCHEITGTGINSFTSSKNTKAVSIFAWKQPLKSWGFTLWKHFLLYFKKIRVKKTFFLEVTGMSCEHFLFSRLQQPN